MRREFDVTTGNGSNRDGKMAVEEGNCTTYAMNDIRESKFLEP